jgi:hypothetical protein
MKSLSTYGKWSISLMVGLWVLVTGFIVITECRFPGSDVFLFKEAAVNFALKTRLVASNLVYMPLDMELPFAHYPPVYPTVFGLWMKVFGVGLKQSLLFECFVRGLRSFLLGALIWRYLKSAFNGKQTRLWALATIFFLFLISLVSTDDDRPDELGLVFGLSTWWLLLKAKQRYQFLMAGLFLGVTGATSPACSVCIGLGVLIYLASKARNLSQIMILGFGAIVSFSICVAPIPLAHHEVLHRFSISANASSLPFPIPWLHGMPFSKFVARFEYCMNHYFGVGFNLVFCLFCSSAVVFLMRDRLKTKIHPFQLSSLIFALMAPFIWSLQPYYLWFAVLPISIFFIAAQLKRHVPNRAFAFLGICVAFFPILFHESKNFIAVMNRPLQEKSGFVREQLLKQIKPEERVAVSSDQFFTLRNYREVANVGFVCHGLDRFDYIYVTRIWSAKQGHPSAVPIPCNYSKYLKCFEPVDNLSKNFPLIIAGWNTGYVARGNGGTLYKNTRCHETITHQVASGFPNQF